MEELKVKYDIKQLVKVREELVELFRTKKLRNGIEYKLSMVNPNSPNPSLLLLTIDRPLAKKTAAWRRTSETIHALLKTYGSKVTIDELDYESLNTRLNIHELSEFRKTHPYVSKKETVELEDEVVITAVLKKPPVQPKIALQKSSVVKKRERTKSVETRIMVSSILSFVAQISGFEETFIASSGVRKALVCRTAYMATADRAIPGVAISALVWPLARDFTQFYTCRNLHNKLSDPNNTSDEAVWYRELMQKLAEAFPAPPKAQENVPFAERSARKRKNLKFCHTAGVMLVALACSVWKLSITQLCSKQRTGELVHARMAITALLKSWYPDAPYREIGVLFNRDHTSALYWHRLHGTYLSPLLCDTSDSQVLLYWSMLEQLREAAVCLRAAS